MFALVDCNNFYVACERLFRPDLQHRPVIVLSNNDGCVIARSNEAKAIGIGMGVPYFTIKGLCKQHGVVVFSSNFALYGDLSSRVMRLITEAWPHHELYSIDEAFLDLKGLAKHEQEDFCISLQKRLLKEIGIPTTIGIGQTKTLAKTANYLAKTVLKTSVFNLDNSIWLKQVPIDAIWGVGKALAKKLRALGMLNAADLAASDKHWLKQRFSVVLMRTAYELAGLSCLDLEQTVNRKSVLASRSFEQLITEPTLLAQALANHCARAHEKLRSQNLLAGCVHVFLHTNRHRIDLAQAHVVTAVKLITPTDDLRQLTRIAKQCLKKLVQPGFAYKKVGVCFQDLVEQHSLQPDLFDEASADCLLQKEQLMKIMETINYKFGRQTIHLAAANPSRSQAQLSSKKWRSPCYTTRWEDLPLVRL